MQVTEQLGTSCLASGERDSSRRTRGGFSLCGGRSSGSLKGETVTGDYGRRVKKTVVEYVRDDLGYWIGLVHDESG